MSVITFQMVFDSAWDRISKGESVVERPVRFGDTVVGAALPDAYCKEAKNDTLLTAKDIQAKYENVLFESVWTIDAFGNMIAMKVQQALDERGILNVEEAKEGLEYVASIFGILEPHSPAADRRHNAVMVLINSLNDLKVFHSTNVFESFMAMVTVVSCMLSSEQHQSLIGQAEALTLALSSYSDRMLATYYSETEQASQSPEDGQLDD